MCGSCRNGYNLLIGSNKCGKCNNNYKYFRTAGWIALIAVMGILLVVLQYQWVHSMVYYSMLTLSSYTNKFFQLKELYQF